jgi:predicted DNA-binding protein
MQTRIRNNPEMIRTNIYLSRPQRDGFKKLANRTGCTSSELIRRALDHYLRYGGAEDRS